MTFWRFAAAVLFFCFVSCALAARHLAKDELSAVVFSAAVTGANAVAAFGLVLLGERQKSTKRFFLAVLGGMAIRMGAVLSAIVVALKGFSLPKVAVAISFGVYLALFMAAEIFVVHRRLQQKPPITA